MRWLRLLIFTFMVNNSFDVDDEHPMLDKLIVRGAYVLELLCISDVETSAIRMTSSIRAVQKATYLERE